MSRTWEYVYSEGDRPGSIPEEYVSVEYRPGGGGISILTKSGGAVVELVGMPYAEFRALAAVMHEYDLAERALSEERESAGLVRSVLSLSGMGFGELARLLGLSGNAVAAWCAGGRISFASLERLEHIRDALADMPYNPHTGRREALFAHVDGRPSLYEELLRELPRAEPIQGDGYSVAERFSR